MSVPIGSQTVINYKLGAIFDVNKISLSQLLSKHTYCRVKKSSKHGVGVFAIKDIPKYINPFYGPLKTKWLAISPKSLNKVDQEVATMVRAFFSLQNGLFWVPEGGLNSIDISFFMNTSKKPNVSTDSDGDSFYTLRKIKKGEELTIDYQIFDEQRYPFVIE